MLLWGKHLQKIVTRQAYNACTSLYYKKYVYVKWVGLGLARPPRGYAPAIDFPLRGGRRKKKTADKSRPILFLSVIIVENNGGTYKVSQFFTQIDNIRSAGRIY